MSTINTFTDTAGRQWLVAVNLSSLRRVSDACGIDLVAQIRTDPSYFGDPLKLFDVIFALIAPQADAKGVTHEAFGEAMTGEELAAASDAMVAAVCDWLPTKQAKPLRTIIARTAELQSKALDAMTRSMESATIEDLAKLLNVPPETAAMVQ